jgi:hypothetical protein
VDNHDLLSMMISCPRPSCIGGDVETHCVGIHHINVLLLSPLLNLCIIGDNDDVKRSDRLKQVGAHLVRE